MTEPEAIDFILSNSFGMLISSTADYPLTTHVPFVFDPASRTVITHVARANPHWHQVDGRPVTLAVSGPHAYISPTWYGIDASVPTWNYVTAQIQGVCRVVDDHEELEQILDRTVRYFDPTSGLPSRAGESFYQTMMKAIVGLRIDVTQIEGAAKLSQNKAEEVRQRVIERLQSSDAAMDRDVARWMEAVRRR